MTSSKLTLSKPEAELDSKSEDRSSHWYLLEIRADSEAEEFLHWLLVGALTEIIPGVHYSAQCRALSIAEALAEFAQLGRCDRSLYLRLLVHHTLKPE